VVIASARHFGLESNERMTSLYLVTWSSSDIAVSSNLAKQ
jgi:hypothetical protein